MRPHRHEPLILVEWLRFACALGIVALHYGVTFWHAPSIRSYHLLAGVQYRSQAEASFTQGWIGVELFFVISGMVIAQSTRAVSRAEFIRRRLHRLVPGAWICATITLFAVAAGLGWSGELVTDWLRSVAFSPVFAQIDDSYWTLGVELAFYLAVTVGLGGRGAGGKVTGVAMLIGGASALFWFSDLLGADPSAAAGDRLLQLALLPHGCFFALGVLLAKIDARRLSRRLIGGIAVMLLACGIEVIRHAQSSTRLTGIVTPDAVPLALFIVGIAALVGARHVQRPLSRWCSPATARRWGYTTYPLYLLHQDAGAALTGFLARAGLAVGLALSVTAGVVVGASYAIGSYAEPALRRWLIDPRIRRRGASASDRPSAPFPSN